MDDTFAMQDTNVRVSDGPTAGAGPIDDKLADLKGLPAVPVGPITPPQGSDAVSVASDSSSQEQNIRQPVLVSRATHNGTDVDAAKQAALSALAGLDLTTTKANLDASKAAAATAKANGELPVHSRKASLRSVSCRQLGSSSASPAATAGKTVVFDDTAKPRTGPDTVRPAPGQWRTSAVADNLSCRTARAPASRCISLPHIMHGSAGMNKRPAATYPHDAALQQQFQLLGGAAGQQFVGYGQMQPGGAHQMDALSMYQLQQQLQQQVANAPAALLGQQRTFVPVAASLEDSVVPVQAGNIILQRAQLPLQQLQQVQPQQARLAGTWGTAATAAPQQQLPGWAAGQVAQQGIGQAGGANVQLLAQLQAGAQGQFKGDTMWVAPTSTSLQLPTSRPQGMVMQQSSVPNDLAGTAGLQQQQQQLLAGQLQSAGNAGSVASSTAGGTQVTAGVVANDHTLLEKYQSVSWSVLAAAQGESTLRNQLLTELVLLLTLLHTLNNMMKGSMTAAEALSDLNYLASAARHHMATFSRLSQAGNIAVQLLAVITPLALRPLNSTELLEAAFLILDTLALASRDVAVVVSQQRMAATASMGMQVPMDRLLQQQTLGLHWIAGLASAVSRNKAVLESMADDSSARGVAGAAPRTSGSGLSGGGGLPMDNSQPMMVAPTANATAALGSNALSPNRKTPLATYFEETSMAPGASSGASSGPGGPASMAAAGGAGGMVLTANGLAGVQLAGPAGQESTAGSGLTAIAGGYAGLDNLGCLSLGVTAGKLAPAGPGQQSTAAMVGGVATGTYSPLGGGLSLGMVL